MDDDDCGFTMDDDGDEEDVKESENNKSKEIKKEETKSSSSETKSDEQEKEKKETTPMIYKSKLWATMVELYSIHHCIPSNYICIPLKLHYSTLK